jgi:hypothetical protein
MNMRLLCITQSIHASDHKSCSVSWKLYSDVKKSINTNLLDLGEKYLYRFR